MKKQVYVVLWEKKFLMCDGSWSKQEGFKSAQVLEAQMEGFNISRSFILEMWMQLEGLQACFYKHGSN